MYLIMVERDIDLVHARMGGYFSRWIFSKWTSCSLDPWSDGRRSTFDVPKRMKVMVVHGQTESEGSLAFLVPFFPQPAQSLRIVNSATLFT
jgi:hypothetical protein